MIKHYLSEVVFMALITLKNNMSDAQYVQCLNTVFKMYVWLIITT